jgi:hypothetical protein
LDVPKLIPGKIRAGDEHEAMFLERNVRLIFDSWHLLSEDIAFARDYDFLISTLRRKEALKCGTSDFKVLTVTFPCRKSDKESKTVATDVGFGAFLCPTFRLVFPGSHPNLFTVPPIAPPTLQIKAFFCPVWKESNNLIHARMLMTESS